MLLQLRLGGAISRDALEALAASLHLSSKARAVCVDGHDRPGRVGEPEVSRFEAEGASADRVSAALKIAFEALDPLDQRILALKFGRKMTMKEIAARLGGSAEQLQKRYVRLRPKLRAEFEKADITPADLDGVIDGPGLTLELFVRTFADLDSQLEHCRQEKRREEKRREKTVLERENCASRGGTSRCPKSQETRRAER